MLNAAVIGGGISGLASAYRIAGLGHRVTLLEGEDYLGGLGTTFPYQNGHLERFYHCILPNDGALLAFIKDLGLGDELLWRETKMGFMYRKSIFPLNTAMDLLRFSPLTFLERLRMGLMGIRARYAGLDPELDGVTAAEWVRGMAGERAFNILWKPLLSAKIGDHYAALPALWLSSRMNREKNTGPEQKGCLKRGYRSLIDAFQRGLESRGATIRLKTKVEAIERAGEGMAIRYMDGRVEKYDFVVSTVPLVLFQQLTRGLALDPALADLKLDYQGVISGVFLTRAPLTHYYWMPFVDSGAMAQGAIEMSNLVPLERSNGLHVNYLVNYTHRSGELYGRTDQQLLDGYRKDLETFFPAAGNSIVDQFLFRAPYVEPIWTVNYNRVKPPASVIPGRLYLSCTAQLYPRVNSWNSCCEIVEAMMPKLAAETSTLAAEKKSAIA